MLLIDLSAHPGPKDLKINERVDAILDENRRLLQNLDKEAVKEFVHRVLTARSVFCSAQGRSGFILRCFCMRLMHLGSNVHFCGETVTPALGREDLLVVLSGSGETASTLEAVKDAKEREAYTFGILGNLDSSIGSLVDGSILLPGTTKLCLESEPQSVQMAGSLFEQSSFLLLEAVVLALYQEAIEVVGSVSPRHAVIE
jgi:6-phospho-3-hexuloisomerase